MRKNLGILVIFALVIIPFSRWLIIEPLNYRFFNLIATATSLGQIAGIIGLTLFSINLILSARFKIVERFFYGLNRIYNFHHQIGIISFLLILVHPLFLVVSYLSVSLSSALDFFTPFKDITVTYGIISLLLMIALMVLTLYIKLKYNNWKLSHKFMVIVFAFALLHSLYISSDISRDNFLRVYLLSLGALGFMAGFYQAFLSKFFNFNLVYILNKVNLVNSQIAELELEPKDKKIKFQPGQFIFIRFLSKEIGRESHPFSISSAPDKNNLQLVIKSLGDFTAKLKLLRPGIEAVIEGPYGKFSYLNILNKNQIWIAGGVGITPFLSMARSLNNDYNIDLYYCVGRPEEAVFLNELKELEATKKIKLFPWCSLDRGRLDAQAIIKASAGLENKDILLCGPLPFMASLKDQFLKLNVKRKNIHFEEFKF